MLRTRIFKSWLFAFNIHYFNIDFFAIEMIKVNNNIAPTNTDEILTRCYHSYSLHPKSNSIFVATVRKQLKLCTILWYPYLEYDTGLDKNF